MAQQKLITMATLGRPFHLGMLYDVRSDKIITGTTLWDRKNLANHTDKRTQPYTGYEIISDDSLQNKAHALGVDASLKLSLLGGLVNIAGSAKYAEDFQQTKHESRLTLKYSRTTHFEQLIMEHLGKGKLNHPDPHDLELATHVVTGVLYGAEAFFVFNHTVSKGESKKEISGKLKVMINKIPKFKVEGDVALNLNDQEKNFIDKLNCKFYGDFHLDENPSTFDEAVKIYRQLPSLVGKNNENVVPKKVWLYPLSLLDSKAMRFVREISSKLIDFSISFVEKLHSFEIEASDLSTASIFTDFDYMKEHLLDFAERLSEFQRHLREKIGQYLPKIRGNSNTTESVLYNLFRQVDSSPFNKRKLELWLKEKREAVAITTTLIEKIAKHKSLRIMIGSSSLSEAIADNEYDYIYCLSFRLVEENDSQLNDMGSYLYNEGTPNSSHSRRKHKSWFKDRNLVSKIHQNIRQFIEFEEANNVEDRRIKFIVNEKYANDHINKSVELILYENGSEKKGFIIPSKPDAPYAKNITDNSVTLTWRDVAKGSEKVIKYQVMYKKYVSKTSSYEKENELEEKWTKIYTNSNDKQIIIPNLPSKTTFVFRVQSITAIGHSAISDSSKPIDTLTKKEDKPGTQVISRTNNITQWKQHGIIVAGGHGLGSELNQLFWPSGLSIDNDQQSIYIADMENHRIVEWKFNAKRGPIIAGGNGYGNQINQLYHPTDVLVDTKNNSLIICDRENKRVVEWSRQNGTKNGQILISDIDCYGITTDKNGYIYVSDYRKNEVRRWKRGETNGVVVAGGNGKGDHLNQLNSPGYLFIDQDDSLYVSDWKNHRVMKWMKNTTQGIIVAGGQGEGYKLTHLSYPQGVIVDHLGNVYVADHGNNRIMCWSKGSKQGRIIVGGISKGQQANQLNRPVGISFDREDNLHVADCWNNRVQKFEIEK